MSEPKKKAQRKKVAEDVLRYTLHDDRIKYESDSFALLTPQGTVLLDPLPLTEKELKRLLPIRAIVLSATCHQRAAWRYRRRFRIKVYAPRGARKGEGKPDVYYSAGDGLPGGLEAVHAPGPTDAHYAFHLRKGGGVIFVADLLTHAPGEDVAFVPDRHQDDAKETRRSVRKLLRRKFKVICFNHGVPITEKAHFAIRNALRRQGPSLRSATCPSPETTGRYCSGNPGQARSILRCDAARHL